MLESIISLVVTWALLTLAIVVVGAAVKGVEVRGVKDALIVAAIYGVISWALGRFLFSRPEFSTHVNLGDVLPFIGWWITCTLMLKLTDLLTKRLTIQGFKPAIKGGLVMSLVLVAMQIVRRNFF